MNRQTFKSNCFADVKTAIRICSRMGWSLEEWNSDTFTITFPEEDTEIVTFIFEYFM